jgi:hypothetical protein
MNDCESFNEVVERLLVDRSPATQARYLGIEEQRMLILAQRIRGSREQRPDPGFMEALDFQLWCRSLSSTRSVDN